MEKIKAWLKQYFHAINLWFYLGMILLSLALFLLDYFTKHWAYWTFYDGIRYSGSSAYYTGPSKQGIPGLIEFTLVFNNGAAWNWLANQKWILVTISLLASLALLFFLLFRANKYPKVFMVGIALMLSGAVGNLVDRIGYWARAGIYKYGVIDFLQFSFWKTFPVCNIADYCLSVGIVVLVIGAIIYSHQISKAEKSSEKEAEEQLSSHDDEVIFDKKLVELSKNQEKDKTNEEKKDGTEVHSHTENQA